MKPKKTPMVFRKYYIDDHNLLLIGSTDKLVKIKLHLFGSKPRRIGTITKSTRTIAVRRVRSKHLFRKFNAYGFNDYILRNQTTFDWIRLSDDEGNHWKIPVKFVMEHGKYLNFKEQGFELQRFVSLDQIEQFRVRRDENRRF